MATRIRSVQAKKDDLISPPDWGSEALVAHRALWEIAAMAGDVEPKLAAVKAKKDSDLEWKEEYDRRVRVMANAISESRGPLPDHIYYDRHRAGNAARAQEPSKLRQIRVDVASAIEFLWSTFGKGSFPAGLLEIHQKLSKQDANASEYGVAERLKEPIASTEQPRAAKGPSHRDQKLANATKEINRLQTLVYILSRELYGVPTDSETPPPTLQDDVLDSVEKAGLKGREGLGADGVQTLLEKSFKYFWQLKR